MASIRTPKIIAQMTNSLLGLNKEIPITKIKGKLKLSPIKEKAGATAT